MKRLVLAVLVLLSVMGCEEKHEEVRVAPRVVFSGVLKEMRISECHTQIVTIDNGSYVVGRIIHGYSAPGQDVLITEDKDQDKYNIYLDGKYVDFAYKY